MRKLIVVFTLCLAGAQPLCAQTSTPDAPPSWQKLQGLPSGLGISVKAHKASSANCTFKSAGESEMTCVNGGGTPLVFQRSDVKSVKIRHRGRSTLVGFAIGAGLGAAIGAPLGQSHSFIGHGAAATIIAVPGAIIGTVIGAATDFTHSTVYKSH